MEYRVPTEPCAMMLILEETGQEAGRGREAHAVCLWARSPEARKRRPWVRSTVVGSLEMKWEIWHSGLRGGKDVPGGKHQTTRKICTLSVRPPAHSPHPHPAPRIVAARHAPDSRLESSLGNTIYTSGKTYRNWRLRNFQWNSSVCQGSPHSDALLP